MQLHRGEVSFKGGLVSTLSEIHMDHRYLFLRSILILEGLR